MAHLGPLVESLPAGLLHQVGNQTQTNTDKPTQSQKHKVNRCLARYSPRATTTNRPTNRALNKPAWPGPN